MDGCFPGKHYGTVYYPCGSPAANGEIGGEWRYSRFADELAAIQGTQVALEGKIESIALEVNLLRADHRKVSDKVKVAEGSIAELQSEVGTLRTQMGPIGFGVFMPTMVARTSVLLNRNLWH
ncbi:hypothetical protein NDU88_005934 [Pleurodeles waltl]|uniref:Uncharacterized protein n=1 Tax=Pleurodeles waltl TaxID=8319 RepID=A0AAV7PPY7_PLEWA|nr:hypothetical protein NDU88_005934 [Pleurodeles waltl]